MLTSNFKEVKKFLKNFPSFSHLDLIGLHIIYSLNLAEQNALGVSIAVIALNCHPIFGIKERMIKRAGHDTGLASNAEIFIDDHSVMEFRFSVARLGWTHFKAIGLFTVVAD